MEDYDFEKLAREIVTQRLKGIDDAPKAAAEIAKKIIVAGVQGTKSRQDPHLTVSAVCRGVISGMILIEADLPETAVFILREMANIAAETHLDPTEMMTWSMEGIGQVAPMAGAEVSGRIHDRIEETFQGAGLVFRDILERLRKSQAGG